MADLGFEKEGGGGFNPTGGGVVLYGVPAGSKAFIYRRTNIIFRPTNINFRPTINKYRRTHIYLSPHR